MEFEVKESISLKDGSHEGVITSIEYTEEPYKYTNISIKEAVTGLEIRYGCPTNASEKSKLMQLLGEFEAIKPGMTVNPEKILIDKKVTFMTITEKKDGKEYTQIVSGSVKPL